MNISDNTFFSSYCWNTQTYTNIDKTTERVARIIACDRGRYLCATQEGTVHARPQKENSNNTIQPATGDWILLEQGEHPRIQTVLQRSSSLMRKDPGKESSAQLIAANCDFVLIQISCEEGLRSGKALRLIEAAWESGASPVLLLSKIDLCEEPDLLAAGYQTLAPGVPTVPISVVTGEGIETLKSYLSTGKTSVLIGASGCGKSTLLNLLLGREQQKTGAVRDSDKRGRHTTVRRMLFRLPEGGCLIDTPGIREWGIWAEQGSSHNDEIASFSERCRFRDCTHISEPGCAVTEAVRNREIPQEVYQHYLKQRQEQQSLLIRRDEKVRRDEEKKFAKICKEAKKWHKKKRFDP